MTTQPSPALAVFQQASWKDAAEIEEYVRRVGIIELPLAEDMVQCLKRPPKGVNPAQVQNLHRVFAHICANQRDPAIFMLLADTLEWPNDQVRRTLSQILGGIKEPAVEQKLITYLQHKDQRLRGHVSKILSRTGNQATVNAIQNLLPGQAWTSRVEAINVLAFLGESRAISLFRKALDYTSRDEVLRMIDHLVDERVNLNHRPEAVDVLLRIVRGEDPVQRQKAIEALGKVAGEETAMAVGELVWDEDPTLAQQAVVVLGKLGGTGAISTLARVAQIGHPSMRVAAAKGLAATKSEEAIYPLIQLLAHEDMMVRDAAIDGLTRLGHTDGIDVTRMLVEMTSSEDVNVRRAVIEIVDSIGDPDGTFWQRMVRRLRDSDWWVRERATEVLLKIARHQVLDQVMDLLADESDVVRRYGIDVLVKFREQRGIVPLARMARDDEDWLVREKAVEALGEIGDERVVPMLLELSTEADLEWSVVQALGALQDERSVPRFLEIFGGGSAEMKLHILRAADRIPGESPRKVFETAVADVEKEVREEAVQLLAIRRVRVNDAAVKKRMARSIHYIDRLLEETRRREGTDLYIMAGRPPCMKLYSDVVPLDDEVITPEAAEELARVVLSEVKWQEFLETHDVDSSYQSMSEKFRFRVNVFRQRKGVSTVFRVISEEILPFKALGLPDVVLDFTTYRSGLVLVSGPTNSGKSTTLTTLVDHINTNWPKHIITIEDPIEYVHENKKCLVNQREIGTHAKSFDRALRSLLREDPDVILLGEMRDRETIGFAVTAAETGHLVLATLHTVSAPKTIERIVDAFPAHQQGQIRVMLSESLRGIVCQQLLDLADGNGRILAAELLVNTPAVSNMIRNGKSHHISQVLTTQYDMGMRLLDRELLRLVREGVVTIEEAFAKANDARSFMKMVEDAKMGAIDVDAIGPDKRLPTESGEMEVP